MRQTIIFLRKKISVHVFFSKSFSPPFSPNIILYLFTTLFPSCDAFAVLIDNANTPSSTYHQLSIMTLFLHNSRSPFLLTVRQWFSLFLIIHLTSSQQIFTAQAILSDVGTQFVPGSMSTQLLSTVAVDSVEKCALICLNNVWCSIYDYEASGVKQCRLFEGDANKHGQILPSSSPQSTAGLIRLSSELFAEYGRPCSSFCSHSRYLRCGKNSTCECMPHTYWNGSMSMCIAQSPILGASCQQNMRMCREDLNYTCLQFNQCGRK